MRKDFLIAKKMWLIILVLYWIVSVFLGYMSEDRVLPAGIVLTVISVLLGMMILSSIFEEEEKHPKVSALITTIGYKRSSQVLTRYILSLLLYAYCVIVYVIVSGFMEGLLGIGFFDLALSFFCFSFAMSLYLALVLKCGIRAGRYIMVVVIMIISLGPTLIAKLGFKPDFSFLMNIGETALIIIFLVLAGLFYIISLSAGIRVYNHKEF